MENDKRFLARKIFNIIYTIVIIITGICFMAGCLVIYNSGDKPFTRETVGAALLQISFPILLFLGMTAASIVWELLSPMTKKQPKVPKDYVHILECLHEKHDKTGANVALLQKIETLRKKRIYDRIVLALLSVLFFMIFLWYVASTVNFDDTSKTGMITAMITSMYVFIPCTILTLGYGFYVSYSSVRDYEQEITLVKQLAPVTCVSAEATGGAEQTSVLARTRRKERNLLYTRVAILTCSILFILFGMANDGVVDVLAKAIQICTECIGLG